MVDGSHKRPLGMAKNVSVMVNGETVVTDFVVLKDVHEEEKCGPDTVLLGWPFLYTARMDISIYRHIETYYTGGRRGVVKAMDHIPGEYIMKEYSVGFVKHLYILAKLEDKNLTAGRSSTRVGAP